MLEKPVLDEKTTWFLWENQTNLPRERKCIPFLKTQSSKLKASLKPRFSSFIVFLLTILCFSSPAFAKKIEIIQAERLELRNITLPDGKIEEYVTITGKPAIVRIEKDELEANRIEFNKTKRKLYIVGQGVLRGEKETIAGNDFVVDTSDNSLEGTDTLIATSDIDVVGVSVERLPGQLEVRNGYFSPCSRCGKVGDAYGFKAGSLTLFPGDRLIARDVTILIAGEPVLYLPVMVVLLSEPSRQPRWVIRIGGLDVGGSSSSGTSGSSLPNVELDLPFTTGDFGLGFTLLRYYGDRNPAFGVGIDWTLFDLLDGINKSRVFFLILPPAPGSEKSSAFLGAPIAYRLESAGSFDITPGSDPEDALPSVKYSFSLSRQDSEIGRSEDVRGLSGPNRRTDFGAKFNLDTSNYTLDLEISSFFLNRDPILSNTLRFPSASLVPSNTLYFPELRFTAKDTLLPKLGGLAVQNFSVTLGVVTAPFNRVNRSARFAADPLTGLVTAGKLSVKYGVGFNVTPWEGANLSSSFRFEGRYYTTQNPTNSSAAEILRPTGEFERSVDYQFTFGFSQSFLKDVVKLNFTNEYGSTSGESPFAFDSVSSRESALRSSLSLTAKPLAWLSFGASESLTLSANAAPRLLPANFNLEITPAFGSFNFRATQNLETGILQSWSIGASIRTDFGITVGLNTGQNLNPNYKTANDLFYRFLPLSFDVAYNSSDAGKFSASLSVIHDINPNGTIQNINFGFNWKFGETETPFSLSVNQNLVPPQNIFANDVKSAFSSLRGSVRFGWRGLNISFENSFDFKPWTYSSQNTNTSTSSSSLSPSSSIRLGIAADAPFIWSLNFSSNLDLATLEFFEPLLSGQISSSVKGNAFDYEIGFQFRLPDRNQQDFRLTSLRFGFGWDVVPGFSISGSIEYSRTLDFSKKFFLDKFSFSPLAFTTAFTSEGSSKPDVFVSVVLRGSYEFSDDPNLNGVPNFTLGNENYRTTWRPVFILTFDLCCYTLQFTFDSTPKAGASFTFSFILPFGGKQNALISDSTGLRFPILPFIQPIK